MRYADSRSTYQVKRLFYKILSFNPLSKTLRHCTLSLRHNPVCYTGLRFTLILSSRLQESFRCFE
jgi:hypothetical protein